MRELTIFNFGEVKYGIWRNEAIAVKDVEHIHWLPPIPKHIAGMSILEDRTVTMFDLPACIGLSPLARKRQKYSVILFEQEKDVAGFLLDIIIGHFSISSETVHKMPDYLRTEVIDTCAVHNSELIPVISLSKLFKIVLQADFKPPEAELRIPEIQQNKTSLVNTVRIFKSGGEYFAVPSENIEKASVKPDLVSNMTLVHKHVSGIIFHGGKLIPLIHISSRINEKKEQIYPIKKTPLVLIADIGGQSFGLLVDADRGEWDDINFDVKPLPPLVQSSWMKSAGVLGKDIIPIIDNGALLSERHDDDYWNSLPQRYTADSNVKAIFGREEVKVIEFSLLGLRHALPDSEVKDSFKVRAYRRLPNVIPIVAGVTEHDGKLLPVLDLGMYFGRSSPVTPEWWMILVKNGDFHALILAETVLGKRLLPVNIQQELPFEEPHAIVYGCYPDEAAIRLVLNVEAMTVHFDEVRFKELISMLAEGVEPVPEEIGPEILELEAAELAIEPEAETVEDTTSEEIRDEQKPEEIEVIEQEEEILEPIESEDSIDLIDLIEPEESVDLIDVIEPEESIGLIEPVVSKETDKKEEEESQVEPEKQVYLEEAVGFEVESETEEPKIEVTEETKRESGIEEIGVIENKIESEESVDLIDLIEPEESIELIEPVVSKETEEEEEEIQVEAEEPVHERETVEFAVESETEESKIEVKEETKRESKIEEIGIIENKIEPELEEFIGLVESLMKEETEEVKEIQEQGEIPITEVEMKAAENEEAALLEKDSETVVMPEKTALSLTDMSDHFKTDPFGKTTRWPFLIILAALSFFLLLIPTLYFFGVLDNWFGKKDKGKIETSAVMNMPLSDQIETPKFLTPKDSTKTPPTPVKSQKSSVPEKSTAISHKPIEPLKPVAIKKPPKISPAPTKPQKKQVPEKATPISIAPVKSLKPSTPEKPPTISHWTVVYTVKRGDTLFKITRKYTGDGYDFPEVAKKNKIKNQDLIYPGQKIQLKR